MKDPFEELDLERWTWELPRSTPGPYVAEHIPKPLITDWVEEWKPVILEALEKAEKFDRYHLYTISMEESGVWGAINKLDAKLEGVKTSILNSRNKLYEALPSGDIDSFALLKIIQSHITELDEILGPETVDSEGERT